MITIRIKNFDNEYQRITWKINGMFLNVFYHKKENGVSYFDRFFFTVLMPGYDTREALVKTLEMVEDYYGIELLKKYEPYQLN